MNSSPFFRTGGPDGAAPTATMLHYCTNPACGRPFQVNRFDAALTAATAAGTITCPHCGVQIAADKRYIFLTHALSAAEEAALAARRGAKDRD